MPRRTSPATDLEGQITQARFASLIGVSEAAVSKLVTAGVLKSEATGHQWLLDYCQRLREQAAGRLGDGSGADLPYERALLAREQRRGHEIKNAVALGKWAPIEILADVLANASAAIVDRLDQLPAAISRACPDLPAAARDAVMREVASARNEAARKTASLTADMVLDEGEMAEDAADSEPTEPEDDA